LGALAYAQGNQIHVAPGQERHLPHEAWHVVQQRQGRVRPTVQLKAGLAVNDEQGLEREADVMGAMALHSPGCSCTGCCGANPAAAAAGLGQAPGTSGSQVPIQLTCERCGSSDHKTNACRVSKKSIDEHREKVKEFHKAKQKTMERQLEEERQGTKKGGTSAFTTKHVKPKGESMERASQKVASTRTFGGGSATGRSTVVDITPEQLQQEERFQTEGLKFGEVDIDGGQVKAKFGVNKPTKFNYKVKTDTVEDDQGKRKIVPGKEELAKPVFGMQGTSVHHLDAVKKEDE
jgi:hypothetical protein